MTTSSNPLNDRFDQFDSNLFNQDDTHLRFVVDILNQAHKTSYAIECLSRILIADDVEGDCADGQTLNEYLRGGLFAAVHQLSESLTSSLSSKADSLEKILEAERKAVADRRASASKGSK